MSQTLTNIAAALPAMAALQPNRMAIAWPDGRGGFSERTFRELDEDSGRLAAALTAYGITRGTRTVLMVPPSLDFFALTFALFKAGIVPVMVDPGMGLKSLKACLAEAEPEAFIGVPKAHAARIVLGWGKNTIRLGVTAGRRLFRSGHDRTAQCRADGQHRPIHAGKLSNDYLAFNFKPDDEKEYRHQTVLDPVR